MLATLLHSRWLSPRRVNALMALAGLSAMAIALLLQYVQHLLPCPLCIFQRVAMIAVTVFALLAFLHHPRVIWGLRLYAALIALAALAGMAVAGRHVWLQHLPPDLVPACGPGLNFLLQAFPLADVLQLVLKGSGECAKIDFVFLWLSLPEWTLLTFSALFVVALFQLFRPLHSGEPS